MAAEAKNPGSERSCQPPAAGKRRCCSARRPGELCQVYQLDQGGGVRPTGRGGGIICHPHSFSCIVRYLKARTVNILGIAGLIVCVANTQLCP